MWPSLLRDHEQLLQPAYALDSVLIELIFILGPLLTAVLAAGVSPASALIVSAASVITGTIWFTAQAPSRAFEPDREASRSRFGALASPGVRSLILTSLPAGIGIGMVEVGAAGVLRRRGRRRARRPAARDLVARQRGRRPALRRAAANRPPLGRVHLAVSALLPLGLLPLAAAPSVAVMGLLVIPAGAFIAPLLATRNELIGWVAPPGARTEAYTWPVTAFVGGIAIGSALSGVIVEAESWRLAFLVGAAAAACGTLVAIARRGDAASRPPSRAPSRAPSRSRRCR